MRRVEFPDEIDLCAVLGNFEVQQPVGSIDQQTAGAGGLEVGRGAHRGDECPPLLSFWHLIVLGPEDRHHRVVFPAFHRLVIGRFHAEKWIVRFWAFAFGDLPEDDVFRTFRQRKSNAVNIAWPPHIAVADAARGGMLLRARRDEAHGTLGFVSTVMVLPVIAEDEFAETAIPFLFWAVVAVAVVGVFFVAGDVECVGRCAQTDYRATAFEVGVNVLHLFLRKIAEAGRDKHKVSIGQRLEAGDVDAVVRIDDAALGVDREDHTAVETMMP